MKILLAVDGSKYAKKAAEKALDLVKALQAELTVITVAIPVFAPIDKSQAGHHDDPLGKQKELAADILTNYINFFEKENIDIKVKLKEGDPATEICKTATEGDFYMIIMGSRGLTGIKRAILGSVANYVVQSCKIPTLVVK